MTPLMSCISLSFCFLFSDGAFHFLLERLREDSDSFLRKVSCDCLFDLYQKDALPINQDDFYLGSLHILIKTFIKEETKLVKAQLLRLIASIVSDHFSQVFTVFFAKDTPVLEQIKSLGEEQSLSPGMRIFWDVIALVEHVYQPSTLLNIGKDIDYILSLLSSTGGSIQEICLPMLLKTFAATKNNQVGETMALSHNIPMCFKIQYFPFFYLICSFKRSKM